ncbi:MAG: hypothetical protein KatS3mg087_1140 [Patescibacteria group bacterium]|nr:MAG: hypothetical protein KatS3mg087_1140 [Patescibacteria group bacterium]
MSDDGKLLFQDEEIRPADKILCKLKFFVPGKPIPKGSLHGKVIPYYDDKKGGYVYKTALYPHNSTKLKKYVTSIRLAFQKALETSDVAQSVRVRLSRLAWKCQCIFYFQRPKFHFSWRTQALRPVHAYKKHKIKPDVDKLSRAVLDALTGVLWSDDDQVYKIICEKRYCVVPYEEGTHITLVGIDDE